jgi:immunity protein, SdpI family
MKKLDRNDAFSWALVSGSVGLTAALYSRLPPKVPIHFDWHGVPDGFADRAIGAWLLPATAAGLWILLRFGAALLPGAWRKRLEASPTSAAALLVVGLLTLLDVAKLYVALNPGRTAGGAFSIAFAVFWLLLGQILPRIRRNPFIGIRTTWTLTSDENWLRTHRFGGWVFTAAGLAALPCALAGAHAVSLVLIVTSAIVPAVYSYVLARRLPPEV